MKGLIIKDFLTIKGQTKLFVGVTIFYIILSVINPVMDSSFFFVFLIASTCNTCFTYDDKSSWDKYTLTMPIHRKTIVNARYVFGLLMVAIGLIPLLITKIILIAMGKIVLDLNLLASLFGYIIGACLYLSIALPAMFKFGVEKGRYVLMLAFFAPLATVYAGQFLVSITHADVSGLLAPQVILPLLIIVPLVLFVGSYVFAVSSYQKREF